MIQVKFKVAGHILGSAIVEVLVNEDGKTTKLIFTGDIGQPNQPIIEDPDEIAGADFIITESTYGNRVHKAYDKEGELAEIIKETVAKGGNVVIPAFARRAYTGTAVLFPKTTGRGAYTRSADHYRQPHGQ